MSRDCFVGLVKSCRSATLQTPIVFTQTYCCKSHWITIARSQSIFPSRQYCQSLSVTYDVKTSLNLIIVVAYRWRQRTHPHLLSTPKTLAAVSHDSSFSVVIGCWMGRPGFRLPKRPSHFTTLRDKSGPLLDGHTFHTKTSGMLTSIYYQVKNLCFLWYTEPVKWIFISFPRWDSNFKTTYFADNTH
jgi:hypothetical protein